MKVSIRLVGSWISLLVVVLLAYVYRPHLVLRAQDSSKVSSYKQPAAKVYKRHLLLNDNVKFTTASATKANYSKFMEDLRSRLRSGEESYEIAVMRDPSSVPDGARRYLLVELSTDQASITDRTITLAIDLTNAYVVAYRAGERSFFFADSPASATTHLFADTVQTTLAFNSTYPSLRRLAGDRQNINLGILALEEAISTLRRSSQVEDKLKARALTVIIQMVSEAARFRYIEQLVGQSIITGQNFRPDGAVLEFENSWNPLSRAIQQSNKGTFASPIQLQRPNYTIFYVDRVTPGLVSNLAIMLYICGPPRAPRFSRSIKSTAILNGDICVDVEPTVRILGRNNLCVDVRDGRYSDGNLIQLWPCKSNTDPNQLWTLKTDGTIRSNGKCLTTCGYSPGSYVMIYDCSLAVTAATIWQVWVYGSVINSHSGLVLGVPNGNSGTTLTLQTNTYASQQGWLASNNTEPFVTSIVGLNDLCLQANGENIWLADCKGSKLEQKWALYPDGSIRTQQNRDHCLVSNKDKGTVIKIRSCSPESFSQRWMFLNDGTISDMESGMVMDVQASDPSLQKIIIWPSTGNPNQQWVPMF